MNDETPIRILEKDSNRRGDLFGRLMADLFVALGYDQPRLNIHKSGRELDVLADHRLEQRRAIGECKATAEKIGGDDLNKFVGALDVEHEDKRPITGYFISLAGFKETALEQERQRRTKIITLTGTQVVEELINGRILVSKDRATELAGRCCGSIESRSLDPNVELLAHERGWIWLVFYTRGKERTHFALIHSDGTPLARALVDEVIASDGECQGGLHSLTCVNPHPHPGTDAEPQTAEAIAAYHEYLSNECGYIQLDGLPADSDVGSRRLRLEHLFVPLHLDVTVKTGQEPNKMDRQEIGVVLRDYPRLALLAAPGGGKSTLVKRLAIAYADSARRENIADKLPVRDWVPLFFRCRELRGLARGSFDELLEALSQREPVRQYAGIFRAFVDRALLAGRVLLLVDGLDEISDPGDRAAFVCTVRTALQAYPTIAAVVTSREAGFRHVAAHLAPVCTHATISAFDSDDIHRLSISWHKEVVGDTDKVRRDAEQLASTILRNDRIRRLAVNPLLLTTLLLVKRWVGSLPTRRTILYGKAVEVLLMTWNVEGHEPIPEEEALPQLCFIASGMMLSGSQKISRPRLADLLQEARKALPAELGYVKGTVDQFIHRVEDRSSLLMMSGHDVEDGQLAEFFEFRHLTFQEFLTARAMVEGWHPGRKDKDNLVTVLEPHLEEEQWREIIPLAAVLGGKATESLILRLAKKCEEINIHGDSWLGDNGVLIALGNSLADEAPARPETIRAGLHQLVRVADRVIDTHYLATLVRGRYGADFRLEAENQFLKEEFTSGASALFTAIWYQTIGADDIISYVPVATQFLSMLNQPELLIRCEGAIGMAHLTSEVRTDRTNRGDANLEQLIKNARAILERMLFADQAQEQYAACWGVGSIADSRVLTDYPDPKTIARLFDLWQNGLPKDSVALAAEWALLRQPVARRDDRKYESCIPVGDIRRLLRDYSKLDSWQAQPVALVCAWYSRTLQDDELRKRVNTLHSDKRFHETDPVGRALGELLEHLK